MAKKKVKKQLPAQNTNSFDEKQQRYDELVKQCLKIIENPKYPILFIADLVTFLPFGRTTFYEYGLNKSEVLKDAIDNNKIRMKQDLRLKWYNNPNPVLQIALYKMICTEEERNAISNNSHQNKNDNKEIGENLANVLRQLTE